MQDSYKKSIVCILCALCLTTVASAFWMNTAQAMAEEELLVSGTIPQVNDVEAETVSNVMISVPLSASDADGDAVTLKLLETPHLGTAVIDQNQILYTPASNKTGTDEFSYCAVDATGNESFPGKISIKVKKNTAKITYADMTNNPNHLAAIRLAEKGVLLGEKIGTSYFLHPNDLITRSEFIAMTAALADLEITETSCTDFEDDQALSPWAKPYISAAAEAGWIQGYTTAAGTTEIRGEKPITLAEASVILSNFLGNTDAHPTTSIQYRTVPAWAEQATATLSNAQILPSTVQDVTEPVTREMACAMLYEALCFQKD